LKTNNILNVPVATFSSLVKSGSNALNPQYLNAAVTDFTLLANGDIKASQNFESRNNQPVAGFQFNPTNPHNYPGLVSTGSYVYDGLSNIIGLKDEGNRVITNIFGYDDKFVIAATINADPFTDHPAFTSFETSETGNWVIIGSLDYINTSAITGNNCLRLSSTHSIVSPSLNTQKIYRLTFWATDALNVSGAVLIRQGPLINGFRFYEYESVANSTIVSIAGIGNVDELRLYPKNARMRTTTYDPLLGKTSECDENSKIIYYEYDRLGRLAFVKDENHDILKMYEFNSQKNN
jgi:hypothetical protein